MAVLDIALMGEPVLREVSEPVPEAEIKSKKIQSLIDDMIETAKQTPEDGFITAGLAAPQVRQPYRIFLAMSELSSREKPEFDVFINPELEFPSDEMSESCEGCLSTPGICGSVMRYNAVKATYFDREGQKRREKITGDRAVYVQHETDHLEGILWVDKVVDTKTMAFC